MGNCVCIENGKIKSIEVIIKTEESYNNISQKNFKSLKMKEKSNENSIIYNKQNFSRSIISNSSINNSINDFTTYIQQNIKDIPYKNSSFDLSNDIIDKKNNNIDKFNERKYFTKIKKRKMIKNYINIIVLIILKNLFFLNYMNILKKIEN